MSEKKGRSDHGVDVASNVPDDHGNSGQLFEDMASPLLPMMQEEPLLPLEPQLMPSKVSLPVFGAPMQSKILDISKVLKKKDKDSESASQIFSTLVSLLAQKNLLSKFTFKSESSNQLTISSDILTDFISSI